VVTTKDILEELVKRKGGSILIFFPTAGKSKEYMYILLHLSAYFNFL